MLVDSSGTLWGELFSSTTIIDIQNIVDSFLLITGGKYSGLDPMKLLGITVYEIIDGKPKYVDDLIDLEHINTIPPYSISISPELLVSFAYHFNVGTGYGARIQSIDLGKIYTILFSSIYDYISLTNEEYVIGGWIRDGGQYYGIIKITGNSFSSFESVSYTHPPSPRDRTRSRMPSSA